MQNSLPGFSSCFQQTCFFANLALHGLHTTSHTLLCTSMHPCTPFCASLSRASHPYQTFQLTLDPFGYPGQLSPSATGHNAHPWTSVESSPNSAAPIQPICFSLWACTTHIAIQGPCLAGSPLPKQHVFSLCKFFPLFWVTPGGLQGLS